MDFIVWFWPIQWLHLAPRYTIAFKPQCDFVLVDRNGGQHGKFDQIISKLVFSRNWKMLSSPRHRHVIAELLKHKASISSLAKSKGFCGMTKYTALLLRKFTIKSRDCVKLPWRLTSVHKSFKLRKQGFYGGRVTQCDLIHVVVCRINPLGLTTIWVKLLITISRVYQLVRSWELRTWSLKFTASSL